MKQHKFKNRYEKINFLKALQEGKTKISELLPLKIEVWRIEDKGKTWIRTKTGKRYTKQEHDEYVRTKEIYETITIPANLKIV